MTRVVVRPYRESDEAEVVALWTACFRDDQPWNAPRDVIRRKLEVQRELLLIGVLETRLVAAVMAGYDGHRGWIHRLAVAPDVRRRGIGKRLMEEAESRLRERGCAKINLQIYASNREVVAFYERLGFTVEDRVSMGKRL